MWSFEAISRKLSFWFPTETRFGRELELNSHSAEGTWPAGVSVDGIDKRGGRLSESILKIEDCPDAVLPDVRGTATNERDGAVGPVLSTGRASSSHFKKIPACLVCRPPHYERSPRCCPAKQSMTKHSVVKFRWTRVGFMNIVDVSSLPFSCSQNLNDVMA